MKITPFILMLLSIIVSDTVLATTYTIIFSEGHKDFNPDLPYSDLNNKYLANVQIYKDEELLTDSIRGSTLSDSIFYYQMWHKNNRITPPTDNDILEIFKVWGDKAKSIPQHGNIGKFLQNMHDIISHITSIPVLWSGKYKFEIGLHKGGNFFHGQPYVPRIKGTWNKSQPYKYSTDTDDESLMQLNGIWLATINANSAQEMLKVASGINIHDGRRSKDYKDSEGCLTIHPDDWNEFIGALPDIETWKASSHEGVVKIYRCKEGRCPPKPPSNVSVY